MQKLESKSAHRKLVLPGCHTTSNRPDAMAIAAWFLKNGKSSADN